MDTLAQLGIIGATPFVVQFFLDDFSWKHAFAIVVGAVLAILLAIYQGALPADFFTWFFTALNGAIQGAMATAGVSLGFKIAEKVGGSQPAVQ